MQSHKKKFFSKPDWSVIGLLATLVAPILYLLASVVGISAPQSAKDAVEARNYTQPTITGTAWVWECEEGNILRNRFSAVNMQGQKVKGTVCIPLVFGDPVVKVTLDK